MKATELRIGNLYWYQMTDKMDERERWLEQSVIDTDDLIWLMTCPDDPDFMPIKLSEEIFSKFGWKDGFAKGMLTREGLKIRMLGHDMKIDYIHQLQNLYHSLKKEELELIKQQS